MTRTLAPLAALLLLAACQDREVRAVCTTTGNLAQGLSIEVHYPDGRQVTALSNPSLGQTNVVRQSYSEPLVPFLWGLAEPVLDAMPEVEAAPCAGGNSRSLTVAFTDGSSESRIATCSGSALDDMMWQIIQNAPRGRTQTASETEILDDVLTDPVAACTRDW